MKIKSYKHIIFFTIGVVLSLGIYAWFYQSVYYTVFKEWVGVNRFFYVTILILIKIFGIVWPPMTGGMWTFASIPILGWRLAYFSDFVGSMLGSIIAYFIALRWGMYWMKRIFDEVTLTKIHSLRVKEERQFEAIFFLRLFGGSIVEAVCYGAGLLRVKFSKYIWASALSHLAIVMPIYYFTGDFISGKRVIINVLLIFCFACMVVFLRKRYFHYEDK